MNESNYNRVYFELVTVIVLLILCVIFYYKWNASVKEHDAFVNSMNVQKNKDDANKPKKEVIDREVNVYPKIDANIAQINKDVKTLNEAVKRIEKNQITKEQANDKFKTETMDEVSKFFITSGYPNTVVSK